MLWKLVDANGARQLQALRPIGAGIEQSGAHNRRVGVTTIDGVLAVAVFAGLSLNAALGWWWADPGAGYALVHYGAREGHAALTH
ncbi:MAG: cation transporter [Acidimicrobiaceae bacterium]|nr:cation transporter [Acidimicrobiaceae bacterium]